MDATDTDNRERAVATLGKTIYDRSNKDNRSIIEVPLQADSRLYGTLQLADWTCALIGRLADYHFAEDSEFSWAVDLGRSIFTKAQPTSRSVIWSNSPAKDSRCFPKHLIQAERFREIEARNEQRKKRQSEKNTTMLQKMVQPGSPAFEKLTRITQNNVTND